MGGVAIIRWPGEADRLERAREGGIPRLLLVPSECDPPPIADVLEDWVRLPAPEADVEARVHTLRARSAHSALPEVGNGIIALNGAWTTLSPVEERLASQLCERFGRVVSRDSLMRAAWRAEVPTRNALDVHMLRLRRRIERLGLEIHTVRSRGYLLQLQPAPVSS